jgi:serine/threonine protein phosphatase 1
LGAFDIDRKQTPMSELDPALGPWMKCAPSNAAGRDFVVGDLHGCLDELISLLAHVRFDPKLDRLFSVGDLVDRGPRSHAALQLLKKPWFHACRGNHEQLLIEHLRDPGQVNAYDPRWPPRHPRADLEAMLPLLEALPHVWRVGDENDPARFYVLHAEVWSHDGPLTEGDLEDFEAAEGEAAEHCRTMAIWSRKVIGSHWREEPSRFHADELPPIFCGHTIVQAPLFCERAVHIDTGAFVPYTDPASARVEHFGLTLVEPKTMRHWFAATCEQHRGVVIPMEPINASLGPDCGMGARAAQQVA